MGFASDNVFSFQKFMAFVLEFTQRDVSRFPYNISPKIVLNGNVLEHSFGQR